MAEVSSELIFEVLKQVQQRLDRVDNKIDELKSEMNAFRGHMISLHQDTQNIYGMLGRQDVHFERIERRPELSDAPNLT